MSGLTVIDSTPVKSRFVKVDVKSTIGYPATASVRVQCRFTSTETARTTTTVVGTGSPERLSRLSTTTTTTTIEFCFHSRIRLFLLPLPPPLPLHSTPSQPPPPPSPIVAISFCVFLTFQGVYRYSTTLWSSNLSKASVSLSRLSACEFVFLVGSSVRSVLLYVRGSNRTDLLGTESPGRPPGF